MLFIKAKEDYIAAKYLLDGFHNHNLELNLEIIFFHFQQSAEKLIKCLLDYNNIKFPHYHNIREMINIAHDNNIDINFKDELSQLTQYAVEGRYAIIHDDLDDTNTYIEILDSLIKYIKGKIDAE